MKTFWRESIDVGAWLSESRSQGNPASGLAL